MLISDSSLSVSSSLEVPTLIFSVKNKSCIDIRTSPFQAIIQLNCFRIHTCPHFSHPFLYVGWAA